MTDLTPENEVKRLRWMIRYALDGPEDVQSYRKILNDALNGVRGGENVDEVRGELEKARDRFKAVWEAVDTARLRSGYIQHFCRSLAEAQGEAKLIEHAVDAASEAVTP